MVTFLIIFVTVVWLLYKLVSQIGAEISLEAYRATVYRYNRERQRELEALFLQGPPGTKILSELSGVEISNNFKTNYYQVVQAIKVIAQKEGWTYYDIKNELKNPYLKKLHNRLATKNRLY